MYDVMILVGSALLGVAMAVVGHNLLHLPPVVGMMTGLGLLKLFGYYLQRRDERQAYLANTTFMSTALAIDSKQKIDSDHGLGPTAAAFTQ